MLRHRAAPVVLALAVALVGCSGSGSDDAAPSTTAAPTTTTTAPARTDPAEWAEGFCAAFTTWVDAIGAATDTLPATVEPGDYAGAKQAKVAQLDAAAEASGALVEALGELDPPDVEGGDELVADLEDRFDGVQASFEAASADVAALDEDPATFQAALGEVTDRIAQELTVISTAIEELDTAYPSPELDAALASSCQP
ncbi:MAG: hypothetical protein R2702_01805 [Acidimicrobiales bacterium]